MADVSDLMVSSASTPPATNGSASPWQPEPTVPADVSVVMSSQSQIKDLLGLFCMVTLNLIALLANAGVMVAIARAPHLKRFAFVCHLCAVDLLCAILLMPLGIISSSAFFGTVVFAVLECQVYIFLNVFLICLSILTVTAISVERYFYIVHPMRYEVRMTINLAIGVMLLIWFKSLLLAAVTLFGWPAYGHQSSIAAAHCSLHASHSRLRRVFAVLFSVVCFLVPAVVIFAVYCAVYKVGMFYSLSYIVKTFHQGKNLSYVDENSHSYRSLLSLSLCQISVLFIVTRINATNDRTNCLISPIPTRWLARRPYSRSRRPPGPTPARPRTGPTPSTARRR